MNLPRDHNGEILNGAHIFSPFYGSLETIVKAQMKFKHWLSNTKMEEGDWITGEVIRRVFIDEGLREGFPPNPDEGKERRPWYYASYTPREDTKTDQGLDKWLKRYKASDVRKYFDVSLVEFLRLPLPVGNRLLRLANEYTSDHSRRMAAENAAAENNPDNFSIDLDNPYGMPLG